MNSIEEIKRAITVLTPDQVEELIEWLDGRYISSFDTRIEADVATGRLDGLISHALDEERNGRLKPL